jgi:hypothetical protein
MACSQECISHHTLMLTQLLRHALTFSQQLFHHVTALPLLVFQRSELIDKVCTKLKIINLVRARA